MFVTTFSDTDNELTTEVGGYQHVVVLRNTKVVDGDIVEALQQLPRGTNGGDCIHKVIHALSYCVSYSMKKKLLSFNLLQNSHATSLWKITRPYVTKSYLF